MRYQSPDHSPSEAAHPTAGPPDPHTGAGRGGEVREGRGGERREIHVRSCYYLEQKYLLEILEFLHFQLEV